MKNILILFAFGFLFSQCSSLEFEQPLPNVGQDVKTLPRSLVGTYQAVDNSNEMLKKYQKIEYHSKDQVWELYLQYFLMAADLDTTKEAFVQNDSLFSVESDTSGPKFVFTVKRMGDRYLAPPKLRYHIAPSKGKFVLYDEDTGTPSDHTLVLRKQGEVYYFNMKEAGAQFWQTTTLQQTPEGLRFQYLSAPNGNKADLPFVTRAVMGTAADGSPDTTIVARPTDPELAKYMSDEKLVNREDLHRVKGK